MSRAVYRQQDRRVVFRFYYYSLQVRVTNMTRT